MITGKKLISNRNFLIKKFEGKLKNGVLLKWIMVLNLNQNLLLLALDKLIKLSHVV
jgi:hypothetical protein